MIWGTSGGHANTESSWGLLEGTWEGFWEGLRKVTGSFTFVRDDFRARRMALLFQDSVQVAPLCHPKVLSSCVLGRRALELGPEVSARALISGSKCCSLRFLGHCGTEQFVTWRTVSVTLKRFYCSSSLSGCWAARRTATSPIACWGPPAPDSTSGAMPRDCHARAPGLLWPLTGGYSGWGRC